MTKLSTSLFLGTLGLGAGLLSSAPASACGGFFCNRVNAGDPLPVAQTGENVLFSVDPGENGLNKLEAHIQIFYAGPADKFSWVVPVDNKPVLDVGTNQVFQALEAATRPRFQLNWHQEGTCERSSADFASGPSGGGVTADASARGGDGGLAVDVAFRGDVGPYDAAVLKSTDPNDSSGLKTWLTENKYYVSDEAAKIIDAYVREEKYFVALKLINGKNTNEIQPIVLRFLGPYPCVPLRLTAIASVKNLRVNLWVFGPARVVPTNYFELLVNPAKIDWFTGGSNYTQLVTTAADEAGGNAFVTDYAGPSSIMANRLYAAGRLNVSRIAAARTPPEAMVQITAQGFSPDNTMMNILRVRIPLPDVIKRMGVDERTFYNQLTSYWNQYKASFAPFDAKALAQDLDDKIVQPLIKAQALFDKHPKLTRLTTYISPEEMTSDPLFDFNKTLPDVPVLRTAEAYRTCNTRLGYCGSPVRIELVDGQKIHFWPRSGTCGSSYERNDLDKSPSLLAAWQRDSDGEGVKRVDNQAAITRAVRDHNAAFLAASKRAVPTIDGVGTGEEEPRQGSIVGGCAVGGTGDGHALLGAAALLGLVLASLRTRRRG